MDRSPFGDEVGLPKDPEPPDRARRRRRSPSTSSSSESLFRVGPSLTSSRHMELVRYSSARLGRLAQPLLLKM